MPKTCECPYCHGTLGMRYDQEKHTVIVEGVRPGDPEGKPPPGKSEDDLFEECLNGLTDDDDDGQ